MSNLKTTIAMLLLGLTSGSMLAHAHAELDHSVPAAGCTISAAPTEVVLSFSEGIEPKFSGAEVLDSKGAHVEETSTAADSAMHVKLKPLGTGTYQVNWHALSDDTHKTKGSFKFTVSK